MDDDTKIKNTRTSKQMVVTDETENFWHSLPSQKKRRKAHHPHSLAAAVSVNRAAEKKH